MNGILVGHDEQVADWACKQHQVFRMPINAAFGVITPQGELVGAALFQNYNGNSVDFSYYGRNTLTLGIMRSMARAVLQLFGPVRVTIMTSKKKKHMLRWLPKVGCKLEGVSRCYYGRADNNRNTAVRFVLFADALENLALRNGRPDAKRAAA